MDTKRCQRCHKLVRADAQSCSRCGYIFSQVTPVRRRSTSGSHAAVAPSKPSNPPASPHRAGHYSGLHPEDQPYQSSFMPVQRPPAITRRLVRQEPEERFRPLMTAPAASPVAPPLEPLPEHSPKRQTKDLSRVIASPSPLPPPMPQRQVGSPSPSPLPPPSPKPEPLVQHRPVPPLPPSATTYRQVAVPQLEKATRVPRKRRSDDRIVPFLLIASCILFLVATSVLAFLLLDRRPAVSTRPALKVERNVLRIHDSLLLSGSGFQTNDLVNLTRDVNLPILDNQGKSLEVPTDNKGIFAVQITVAENWDVGIHVLHAADSIHAGVSISITVQQTPSTPAQLQLSTSRIDLGVDAEGITSHKIITLINAGGEQIHWLARSDSAWLTITPGSGTFAGSATATLTVSRGTLAPGAYTGQITFSRQGNNNPSLTLTVTMAVNSSPAILGLTPSSLSFNGSTTQNPSGQAIVVQNTGGQPLDWMVSTGTTSGGNWLSVSRVQGHLEANSQDTIIVSAILTGLGAGSYQGALTFSYAGSTPTVRVMVSLRVVLPPAPAMLVKPGTLAFNTIQGTNPAPQSFTITDTGNAPLNWANTEDSNGAAFAPVSSKQGTLAPGQSVSITVTPDIAGATAGIINALITISDTDKGTPIHNQQVKVTISIVNQAVINLSQNKMTFNHSSTITNSTGLLVITNSGSAALNWSLLQNAPPLPSWMSVDLTGGTLAPGTSTFVSVTCDNSGLPAGTYTATLVVSDTDSGTPVASQSVEVTLIIA